MRVGELEKQVRHLIRDTLLPALFVYARTKPLPTSAPYILPFCISILAGKRAGRMLRTYLTLARATRLGVQVQSGRRRASAPPPLRLRSHARPCPIPRGRPAAHRQQHGICPPCSGVAGTVQLGCRGLNPSPACLTVASH
jgi:hypothetical protein